MILDILAQLLSRRRFRRARYYIEEGAEELQDQVVCSIEIRQEHNTLDFGERGKNVDMLRVVCIRWVGEGWQYRADYQIEDVLPFVSFSIAPTVFLDSPSAAVV